MPQSLGIFGGTFDPVHNGHLAIAASALSQLSLDRLVFVPNARSPLKSAGPSAQFADRVAMLRLAVNGDKRIEVSEIEGHRGGTSYTIDTLREIGQANPDAILYLIIGADSLRDFRLWRAHDTILSLARLAYVDRPTTKLQVINDDAIRIEMTPMPVSSSEIRDRIRRGLRIESLVPPSVAAYIAERRLYLPIHT